MSTAFIPTVCATCKAQGRLEVSQRIEGTKVLWHEHFDCQCGHGFDTGGASMPPFAIRLALLEQGGIYEAWVDDEVSRAEVLRVMAQRLSLDGAVAMERVEHFPARVFSGTEVEATLVAWLLEATGVTSARVHRRLNVPTKAEPLPS